jgi:hypothetical protein
LPADIVITISQRAFGEKLADLLSAEGYDAAALPDSVTALDALESASAVQLLVTSLEQDEGTPDGIALARMAVLQCPRQNHLYC